MASYIFYVTDKFLGKVTEESFTKPTDLLKSPHYGLYFELFRYRIRRQREILHIPSSLLNLFKKTKHFTNFMSNPILGGGLKEDTTIFDEKVKEEMHIIECANYKSGEVGETEVCVICCDDEHKDLQAKMEKKGYPFKCISVATAKEMLKRTSF